MSGSRSTQSHGSADGGDPTGVLLINLGTPSGPTRSAVASYLRQFLMDPRVLDLPTWRRFLLVHLLIAPLRSGRSAHAYRQIWTDRGSPLLSHSLDLVDKVADRLGHGAVAVLGMRYGDPSIGAALEHLERRGCRRIVVLPLYAQYTASATASSRAEVMARAAELWDVPEIRILPPFFAHPAYLEAKAQRARPILDQVDPERVFFSFHGIPERQIAKSDPSSQCLRRDDCCHTLGRHNAHCYRAQCFFSARALAERLGIPESKRVVCFQSRLGRRPWIGPYTDQVLAQEAGRGVRRAVIVSSFVTDCLETLEELGLRAVESWREHGGEQLALVPALNSEDAWADAVVEMLIEQAPWLAESLVPFQQPHTTPTATTRATFPAT